MIALRALLWLTLMPGIVAGYVPWRYFGVRNEHFALDASHLLGGVSIVAGAALLLICVYEFAASGRGTLSPVDPPTRLVVKGMYRYVRNPMYLAVTLLLLGQALYTRSTDLVIYWLVFFGTASAFVMIYEEPYLRRQFGAEYDEYTRRVGRWIPKLPAT